MTAGSTATSSAVVEAFRLLITPGSIERHDQLGLVGGLLLGNAPADFQESASLVLSDTMARLLPTVFEFDLPIVAIGDGMHSLNVAMGGERACARVRP